jgi:hypothetical protein
MHQFIYLTIIGATIIVAGLIANNIGGTIPLLPIGNKEENTTSPCRGPAR